MEKTDNENIREDVNRSFETAKLTSYWLKLANVPEAVEYAKLIRLDEEIGSGDMIPHAEDMKFFNPVIHEIRYNSINTYIRQSECRNILDIACGYSPRGILFAREGYRYVGADFPVVAEQLTETTAGLGLDNLKYTGADATNLSSLEAALEGVEGPVCVVVEGLSMYLTADEADTVRRNIAAIMKKRPGSCFVTTDPGNGYLMASVIMAVRPPERFMETIGMFFEMYNWASDGGITTQTEKRPIEADVRMFRESGLEVCMCPWLPGEPDLRTFETLSPEAAATVRKALCTPYTFVCRASDESGMITEKDDFSLSSEVTEGKLYVSLIGRLDVLSSPELMKCIEVHRDSVSSAEIDMSGVTFLSSSGSRTIRMLRNGFGGRLTLTGVRESVREQMENDEIIASHSLSGSAENQQ